MAPPNKKLPAAPEPLNGEQLEAREEQAAAHSMPAAGPGPTEGELEERTVEAEGRAEAAERRADGLEEELRKLQEQVAALMRGARQGRHDAPEPGSAAPAAGPSQAAGGAEPTFDDSLPHGTVVGDSEVAYVQDGHQFGRDRRYLRTEANRGCPRPFNPRLVGWVKPRPGTQQVDVLDGIRGNA